MPDRPRDIDPAALPTMTVAALEAAGYTHVEAHCRCVKSMVPFRMLRLRGQIGDATTYAGIVGRLRCQYCGAPPQSTRPWNDSMDPPPTLASFTRWGQR